MTEVVRETKETNIRVRIASGTGVASVDTTEKFLDHMMVALARYSGLDLDIKATGDLRHHLIEDVAITFGEALQKFVPATAARYGDVTVPMDEALVQVVLDVGGRPYYRGPLPSSLYEHWMRSFADHAKCTLHVRVIRGTDRHHIVEAAFKGLGFALRQALVETGAVFSTKGSVKLEGK